MSDLFTGFSKETFQFFADLAKNNSKEWFDINRSVYEKEVKNKIKSFCISLVPTMSKIDSEFELTPSRCISRINRDTRFSKDKSPYKTHVWITFMHPVKCEEWKDYPGFFIEFNASRMLVGMGMYQPNRKIMDDIRDHISYKSDEFQKETSKLLKKGYHVFGEEYKKQLKNDLPEYFQQWYHRKGISVLKELPYTDSVYSAKILEEVTNEFKSLEWFYNFLKESQPN